MLHWSFLFKFRNPQSAFRNWNGPTFLWMTPIPLRVRNSGCQRRLNSSFIQDQAPGEDQSLSPIIFPTSIPSWSTRYVCGIQPLTPYWSIVFSFKSKRTGRVILFWSIIFWAALFLSPSIVIKRIVNGSLFPWKNFWRANSSSLQDGHQVAQKTMSTGLPLKSLRDTCFPSISLSEKAGASFFSWYLWTPKELQDGCSGWEGEAALTAWRQGISMIVIPIMIESERTTFFFISVSQNYHLLLWRVAAPLAPHR